MSRYWNIKSPITVHVEVTEACNERCRHCYNFYRLKNFKPRSISRENLDRTISELVKNKVMHVIITGGEPLLALDKTIYLAQKSLANNMSVSLNSNLVSAAPRNMRRLRGAGIDHILTTLHSWNEEVHDYVAGAPGAFKRIVRGIRTAQEAGIRVSVNTILFRFNKGDIYKTGIFARSLGVKNFLANRTIPSATNDESLKEEFRVGKKEARRMFNDLQRLKKETGMSVGTCRTVPQCFLGDLDKYSDFAGRGCAAGKRHISLNIDGESHACVHEQKSYGNIHKIGLKKVWENMRRWRTLEFIPKECRACRLFDICDGGCRLVALEHTSSMKGFDNLRVGAGRMPEYDKNIKPEDIEIARMGAFTVHPGFNFREEKGFYIARTTGARVDFIDKDICEALIKHHSDRTPLRLSDLGGENVKELAYFMKRGLVTPIYYKTRELSGKTGCDYGKGYWINAADPDGAVRNRLKERRKRLKECAQEISYINSLKPGRILDIGCGPGFLLSGIDNKWKKYGVEISPFAARRAKRYGKIFCGSLQDAGYHPDYFDVVVLYHVIEHLKEPLKELMLIRRILKPGGRLIIGTPDFECGLAERFGARFRLLYDRTHISLFGTLGLFKVLTDFLFEIEKVSCPFFDTEYFTKENLLRLFDRDTVSPPFYGNIVTFYARKRY